MRVDIRAARVNAGLTQKDAANALGVTQGCLSHWERGSGEPKVTMFFRMCELYGAQPNDVFLPEKSRTT